MIGTRAGIVVITAGRIGSIFAFALDALHRFRTNIGIFSTIAGCFAGRAISRQLALFGHATIRRGFRAAGRAWRKGPADARFVRALIRLCALITVAAVGRIGGIFTLSANALDGLGAHVIVLVAIFGRPALRASGRVFALAGHSAKGP